jgi:predicted 3-demethylubiquinone-9 3-methyltransferase (glyoxalase superfamily)
MPSVQKISPCLWFDRNAEEAVNHYVSIFDNARILSVTRYGDSGPLPKGTVLVIVFELAGQRFMALNGGPMFRFSEAISMVVRCDTQDEINMFWEKLSAGGEKSCCGWLKDKFGLSWQVVPSMLVELMQDPARANRVMAAVMGMKKLDIETMTRAAA